MTVGPGAVELPLLLPPNPPSFLLEIIPGMALVEGLSSYLSAYLGVNKLKIKWHHRLWSSKRVVYLT